MPVDLASNTKLKTILTELRRQLEDSYGDRLAKMILYGSQARGDARQWSDIDVLVVLKGPVQPSQEISRTGGIISDLCLDHNVDIQCYFMAEDDYRQGEERLVKNVRKEGIEI